MAKVDTNSSKVRRMLFCVSPLASGFSLPTSTLLHGHIALAVPSLLETDPHNFGLECCRDAKTALVNLTHRIGISMFELFRKIDEDFGGSIS